MKLEKVPIAACAPSGTNPKGREAGPAFAELVASVREKGVLQPILVRKVVAVKGSGFHYEVVAGHRRLAAAREAGLSEIPAQVATMTNAQALEAQIVENLQRQDISPIEEGEAYRRLIESSKQTVDDIAVKVGKSPRYVRDRLVLTNLVPKLAAMFRGGEIGAGVAAVMARLSPEFQRLSIRTLFESRWNAGQIDVSEAREWVREQVYAAISDAPWQGDDETVKAQLEKDAGPCEECPKGKSDLFGKAAADRCPNPACYAKKIAAYIEIKKRADPTLVSVSSQYGHGGQEGSTKEGALSRSLYHKIESKKDGCENEERGIVSFGEGLGGTIRFCRTADCRKHKAEVTDYAPSKDEKARRKRERVAVARAEQAAHRAIARSIAKVKWPMSERHLDELFKLVVGDKGAQTQMPVCKRRGIKADVKKHDGYNSRDYEKPLVADATKGGAAGKLRLIFELVGQSWKPGDTAKKLKGL